MDIRYPLPRRPSLGRIQKRIRSVLRLTSGAAARSGTGDAGQRASSGSEQTVDAPGNLFHCSTCGSVYIAVEKDVCPECETEVEQVRSTLACR